MDEFQFYSDFHLKSKLTKETMHATQWQNVSLIKVKLIGQKIEIFEEMLIVNGCNAYYCCLYSFIVDFHPLKVKLTKETMHAMWSTMCLKSN